ncbi:hypothetical protein GCM10010193_10290 [Kitasatospora atroaurantiaca]|uniref:Parallel beta helix pectate lyase-like protein n=1 Tax=Kitasatospora atroaurantiaca TaxID=285545 RepID=A0A561ES84_9ACTN|nr:right-handed parallel beta-helix repeat-containing protein [Kitasatospora atroaurantiaca]TWE18478.1 parallel beta helix pectate lyase-like protein [Kitasatospora atroaurantiaca]
MRISGIARAAALPLLLGTTIPALTATNAVADTTPLTTTRYVATGNASCSDSGTGTVRQPFCTITAASAAARPGDTVMVEQGNYPESATISAIGTATAPITFVAVGSHVFIGAAGAGITGNAITVSHAQHVVLRGLTAVASTALAIQVGDSSDITIDGGATDGSIEIDGTSSGVTISRESVIAHANSAAVQVDAGAVRTVVTADNVMSWFGHRPGVQVTDAPGTEIISNTVITACNGGIELDGTSSGSTVENNIIDTSFGPSPGACKTPANATAITVASGSTSGTVTDYNLFNPVSAGAFYSWAGTDYATPGAFAAATGQGTHDIAADPKLTGNGTGYTQWYAPADTSPAIDSANANAPGELSTDFHGNPRMDDPNVTNTGTGAGYHDRGAVELQGPAALLVTPDVIAAPETGPLDAAITVRSYANPSTTSPWTANEPPRENVQYQFSDEPLPSIGIGLTAGTVIPHTFGRAGEFHVGLEYGGNDIRGGLWGRTSTPIVVGANYTPITPTRLLDTRSAIGIPTTTPVPAGGDVVLPITATGSVPADALTAVVANVTVTQPTSAGYLTAYPDGQDLPLASNLNFTPGRTVANLVTVPVTNGKLRLHNGSSGTVHMVLDLQGFYSEQGYGFKDLNPVRVLDTRSSQPVAPRGTYQLSLGSRVPSGTTAVVLNVTATAPTADGFITAYPYGNTRPNASSLNFIHGSTVANLVTVPVVDGKVELYNGSGGSVQLIADLQGYYGTRASGAIQSFVPDGPSRVFDTRTGLGSTYGKAGPLLAFEAQGFGGRTLDSCSLCAYASGWVVNVTATQPSQPGFLTVWGYPSADQRPNASNLNFEAGQTVPNLVVGRADYVYNGSSGTTQVVVDQEGYFISR